MGYSSRLAIVAAVGLMGLAASLSGLAWPTRALDWQIIEHLRWPRVVAAALVGSVLAVCGLLLQILTRNPLAEPYILGLSGGASVAVMAGAVAGISPLFRSPLAVAGALTATLILFALTRGGRADPVRLLLTGVLISAACGALGSLLLTLSDPLQSQTALVWLMGDFGSAGLSLWWALPWVVLVVLLARAGRVMDLMARGQDIAQVLGMPVQKIQVAALALVSLLTALCVAVAGPIGFVGLVVPHVMRLWHGGAHRRLLPLCAAGGAALLIWADWLGQVLVRPIQLPAGVIMALIGVPLLLVLLRGMHVKR
ncbi:FecCD family ABC transporter permease [Litorivicinus lipolyticus]|uniref:FecCD family ABC transporter permease n=1 Tax=Litorivicinus lipolyticus TaxID=418701 RepID=UPI003B5934B4